MLNIAHRGARSVAPENTIAAMEKAAQLGADAVEIDVQLSADGAVVVFHDDDLLRCTDARERFPDRGPWRVSDFKTSDLCALDAGSWFAAEVLAAPERRQPWLRLLTDGERDSWVRPSDLARYASGEVRVPLLVECLEACRRAGLSVHIELKAIPRFYPRLAEKVVDAVRQSGMQGAVLYSSFDHVQLARIAQLWPGAPTGVLTGDRLHRPSEYLARLSASAYCPGCHGAHDTLGLGAVTGQIDRETIAEVRAIGCDVYVWTENDPARMARLIEAGVTGIYTDYPHRLRSLLDARAGASAGGRAG